MKSKPKYIWGTIIRIGGGLIFDEPKKFKYDEEVDSYQFREEFEIENIGYNTFCGMFYEYITFASTRKEEVEAFILGVKSIKDLLKPLITIKENNK